MSAPSNSDDFAEVTENAQSDPVASDATAPPVTASTRGQFGRMNNEAPRVFGIPKHMPSGRGGGERTNSQLSIRH